MTKRGYKNGQEKQFLNNKIEPLKDPGQLHLLFLFTCESLAIIYSLIFHSEHVKTKEITVKIE